MSSFFSFAQSTKLYRSFQIHRKQGFFWGGSRYKEEDRGGKVSHTHTHIHTLSSAPAQWGTHGGRKYSFILQVSNENLENALAPPLSPPNKRGFSLLIFNIFLGFFLIQTWIFGCVLLQKQNQPSETIKKQPKTSMKPMLKFAHHKTTADVQMQYTIHNL